MSEGPGMTLAEIAVDPRLHWLSFAPGLYVPDPPPGTPPPMREVPG